MSPDTWYPHKSPTDQFKGYFKGCTLHCIQIFWYFLDGKNVVRSIHYEHAAYNMLPGNIYAAAHNMLPRELNIPIIKSNTWPREPLPNQLTRKLGALELISPFWMWEQEKQMNKKMKRDNSTKSQHQVLQVSSGDLFFYQKWTFDAHMALTTKQPQNLLKRVPK